MTDKQFLVIILGFILIRYQLDVRAYEAFVNLRSKIADRHTVADEHEDEEVTSAYQDAYSQRIERIREEIDEYNQAPSNAHTSSGTYNLPHDDVVLEVELEPAVEEEQEIGQQEIAR